MLDLITDASEIRSAQRRLTRGLISAASQSISCRVGYQGGSMPITAHWIDACGIWFATKSLRTEPVPRYWNGFGVGQPTRDGHLNIVCEINPPIRGVARQIEGAFARGIDGRVCLLHRGGIGGGHRGIGQTSFFAHFRGEHVPVREVDRESELALVADLESPRLVRQIAMFVKAVEQIKRDATARSLKSRYVRPRTALPSSVSSPFWKEAIKRRAYRVSGLREPSADHGIVVNALETRLRRRGLKTGKTVNKDLVVRGPHGDRVIFEVKTGGTLANVYEAIGQLLIHSDGPQCRRVLVSPPLFPWISNRLRTLRIECLVYSIDNGEPTFGRLAGLL